MLLIGIILRRFVVKIMIVKELQQYSPIFELKCQFCRELLFATNNSFNAGLQMHTCSNKSKCHQIIFTITSMHEVHCFGANGLCPMGLATVWNNLSRIRLNDDNMQQSFFVRLFENNHMLQTTHEIQACRWHSCLRESGSYQITCTMMTVRWKLQCPTFFFTM